MDVKAVNPILNVSSLEQSFAWFEKFGWFKVWEYGEPPEFGAVGSGQTEIFLCRDCQGSKGRSAVKGTFSEGGTVHGDKGVWMSLWVENADVEYEQCVKAGLEIAFEPHDMPWSVREFHVRHPDGHVFRVSQQLDD